MKTILLFLVLAISFNSHAQRKVLKKTKQYTIFVACDSIKMNETGQIKLRVKLAKGYKFQKGYDHTLKNLKVEGLKIKDREIKFSGDDVLDLNFTVKRTGKTSMQGNLDFSIVPIDGGEALNFGPSLAPFSVYTGKDPFE